MAPVFSHRKLTDIRASVQSLRRLQQLIGLLECVRYGNLGPSADKAIAKHFACIGTLFEGRTVPPHNRVREAAEDQSCGPSDEWCDWFRRVVTARNFDDPDISAVACQLDCELGTLAQVLAELPPQVRRLLGREFDRGSDLWLVRVRLENGASVAELESPLREEVEAAGGPTRYIGRHSHWDPLKSFLQDPRWTVDWPDVPTISQRIHRVLDRFEQRGVTSFSATVKDVVRVIRRVLRREQPGWLPTGNAPIGQDVQDKLLAGILAPPVALSPAGLHSLVQEEMRPFEVSSVLIKVALEQLFDAKLIRLREIRYQSPGANEPQVMRCFIRTRPGDGATAESVQADREEGRSQQREMLADNIFRPNGDYWEVRFGGQPASPVAIKNCKGMRQIYQLLNCQGNAISAVDLVREKAPNIASRTAGLELTDFAQGYSGDTLIDHKYLAECKEELRNLDHQLDSAKKDHDEAKVSRIQQDRDQILSTLSPAVGPDGKPRKQYNDDLGKARKTVSQTMATAIEALATKVPKLAEHLRASIKYGRHCSYSPREPVRWELGRAS